MIDIGTTALRMQISEVHPDGKIRKLDSFTQAVSLGKDSFLTGKISKATIEDCVHTLRLYRAKLDEYGIKDARQIRIVATSAVKEANNRMAFLDRIYVATGFEIEPLDEAELHRVTFTGALPLIESFRNVFDKPTVLCEVSGGTTEVLFFKGEEVLYSQTYRQGSLRIHKTMEGYRGPITSYRDAMQALMTGMLGQIRNQAGQFKLKNMIAIGGDIRFAAKQIKESKTDADNLVHKFSVDDLESFVMAILVEPVERLVNKYHLSLPDAESLGPALLTYLTIARELNIQQLYVSEFNLRDGLVKEFASGGQWTDAVERQILRSAVQLGEKFSFDKKHCVHVAHLASTIFDQLRELHQLSQRFQLILEMAATLHEIGVFVSTRSYHKHTAYLVRNAEFFGIGAHDVELVALVARYHRRAFPQPSHDGYSKLSRKDRVSVSKLAAMLRIAKALDVSRSQRIKNLNCQRIGNQTHLRTSDVADLSVERLEISRAATLFDDIFGTQVVLETTGDTE